MDDLIKKVVEKLSLSVDKAPEVYEYLKMQFAVYDICNYLLYVLGITSTIIFFAMLFNLIALSDTTSDEEKTLFIKIGKYLLVTLVGLIITATSVYIYRNLHTQDILFLKEIIGG